MDGDDIAKFRAALKKLGVPFHVEQGAAPAESSWNAGGHPVAPITPDGIAALVAKAKAIVDEPQIVEVIAPVLRVVLERPAAEHLDAGVMHSASHGHLRVAVNDRPASAPEAVPDHEVVLRARVLLIRGERPAA